MDKAGGCSDKGAIVIILIEGYFILMHDSGFIFSCFEDLVVLLIPHKEVSIDSADF